MREMKLENKKFETEKHKLTYEELVEENNIFKLIIDAQNHTIEMNLKTMNKLITTLRDY